MIVNLIKAEQMFSLTLPDKVKGQYWLNDFDEKGTLRQLVSIEAVDGKWCVKSNKKVAILGEKNTPIEKAELSINSFLNLRIENTDERVILFTEPIDETRQTLSKIVVHEGAVFTIGRAEDNNFCYSNGFASTYHAKLMYDGENWSITDLESRNGTYVNGFRIQTQKLNPGDFIYIMGLKIVIGDSYFAINNPDMQLKIRAEGLSRYEQQAVQPLEEVAELPEKKLFFRSPRFHREVKREEIHIDPPPQAQKLDTVPLALMLGPSLTMAMTSVSTGILSVSNVIANGGKITQALPTLVMSVSMLLGTVLWPILTKKHEKKEKIKHEKKRQEKYFAYLNEIGDQIKDIAKQQAGILNETFISQEECLERVIRTKPNLWERSIGQSDFLRLRLGTGTVNMNLDVKYQEKKFTMDDDSLQNAMLALAEEPKQLKNVPISISLTENVAIGVYGDKESRENMVMSLVLQLVSLHGYDEVKLVMITGEEDDATWGFTKYLPHAWNNSHTIRYHAHNLDDVKELSNILEKEVLTRKDASQYRDEEFSPYYVCVVTSDSLRKKCSALKQILSEDKLGFTAIITGDKFSDFPKETRTIIHANGKASKVFDKDDTTGKQISFVADIANKMVFENMSAKLANIELDVAEKSFVLPDMMTFLEMFNVGKVEHLNSLTRWKENNPTKTLQTPIGIGADGDSFMLDLHEKYHGPHGLVAGMTGSGKSEFIITYILSLAVNYHPDEVSFILIDYKGGGLTGAFENPDKGIKLPHLAGTITNLDGAAITRSLVSIQSELRRRQAIFNEARRISNEGTMDIYKYQQLYREKVVSEPMPHLFIISDEFAELKTQQPEFMEQLISAARIGRSLGVHLILATQKPSGVVDDQIWSNSRFRVCLKVQEKSDSQDMIKCSDAAELSQTGRFYLQVGFNELFAMGQSAWCGAEYQPSDVVEKPVDTSIQVVDSLGRPVITVKPSQKAAIGGKTKQIVSIVKYLSDLASDEGVTARTLWLEPIPSHIYVNQLEEKYAIRSYGTELNPVVGEYDDPFNQKQGVLTIPLSKEGNCLVFGATGNGKTTFATTLCYSLIKNHTPDEVNLYLLDYGSETLKAFASAPHVGGIVTASENEKCVNLLKMLLKEMETRKSLFSSFGGDYASYCKTSGKTVPNIVVVLNNFSGFAEQMEDYQEEFALLTRDGVKYGIYFVVTATHTNAVRYRVQQNFKMLLTMQLNDATDYMTIVGKNDGVIPSKFKGRGLVALDRVYEFQTAYCTEDQDTQGFIRKFCEDVRANTTKAAKPIPILPQVVDMEFVERKINGLASIPVGVAKNSLEIITFNLEKKVVLPVLSQDTHEIVYFVEELIPIIARGCQVTLVDTESELDGCESYKTKQKVADVVLEMFNEMVLRNNQYKDANMDSSVLEQYDERCYVIFGVKRLFEQLNDDGRDKLATLLDKADPIYKIHFVLCDSASQMKKHEYDPWYKQHILGADGVWIGEGIADQFAFKINKITSEMYEEVGAHFGYYIYRNRPVLAKLLSAEKKGDGVE
ncbi:MAG: type VII secretion protein EssC [Ruminococcaceae bacterium]|nr:type VII secretion protein EssC [Oscillospiraceae bacterium]